MSQRQPLDVCQIQRLLVELRKVYKCVGKSKARGIGIQYPKIPQKISESLVLYLINGRRILRDLATVVVQLGGGADITLWKGNKAIKIEVKATGAAQFSDFSDKDLHADYIVWLYFGEYFTSAREKYITVYHVRAPKRIFKLGGIKLQKMIQLAGNNLRMYRIDLQAFLRSIPRSRYDVSHTKNTRSSLRSDSHNPLVNKINAPAALKDILAVAKMVINSRISLSQAFTRVAKKRDVEVTVVRSHCTRSLGVSTLQFDHLLKNPRVLKRKLATRFSDYY